jgi:hypothetical protein
MFDGIIFFFFSSWENKMVSSKINSCVQKAAAPSSPPEKLRKIQTVKAREMSD